MNIKIIDLYDAMDMLLLESETLISTLITCLDDAPDIDLEVLVQMLKVKSAEARKTAQQLYRAIASDAKG